MLLTEAQLHEIREIIRDHHHAFIVNTIGPEAVASDVLERLKAKGLVNASVSSIEEAYLYGQMLAAVENPTVASMSYDAFKDFLKKNPIPLSQVERQAMQMAKMKAAQFAVGLGNTVDTQTGATLIEADARLRHQLKAEVKNKTEENIAKRESVKKLKSDLGHATKDWARDWDRIAITEKSEAMQRGLADKYTEKFGSDVLVAKRPMPDACEHCRELHLGPDGLPRIFKLSDLEKNGSNFKKKTADWEATVGPVHPHCQCQLIRVPAGWGFDEDGELVPGAEGGYEAEPLEKGMMLDPMPLHPKVWPKGKIKKIKFQNIDIVIENPRGTIRDWGGGTTLMQCDYGFIAGVLGDDGDELDCYVGQRADAMDAYVIAQQNPKDGRYDEMKVMLGFASQREAENAYAMHYDRPDFHAYTVPMGMESFKQWIGVSMAVDEANGHTDPMFAPEIAVDQLLVIPLNKAGVSADIAAQDSRADGRSPSPGSAVNYFIKPPHKEKPPMVEGWKKELEWLQEGRDPLRRDKEVYHVADTQPRNPHPLTLTDMVSIDNFPESEMLGTKQELYRRYNRNIPISNPVEVGHQGPEPQGPPQYHSQGEAKPKNRPKLVLSKMSNRGRRTGTDE